MLLGRNGASKTTTLRTIVGLWQASQGSIHFNGRDITPAHTCRLRGSTLPTCPRTHGHLCRPDGEGKPAGRTQGQQRSADGRSPPAMDLPAVPGRGEVLEPPAGKLSGGQKQMVAVARAIIEPRDLLIVDEAQQGPGPRHHQQHDRGVRPAQKSGVTILLVEQNIHFAKRLGDTVAVMDNGRVVHAGSIDRAGGGRGVAAVAAGAVAMNCKRNMTSSAYG